MLDKNFVYKKFLDRDADNMSPEELRDSWIKERLRNRELSVELRNRNSEIDQKMFELVCSLRTEVRLLKQELNTQKMINGALKTRKNPKT